ncbi:MarR family winged helix-turn-helix transcriptional regulator [Aeromicrobium massiliense]|uniref:MarR family winged helix-turn-helix transcriptional regulator n=1 Tax=Aeromicrobium massiliense TaxID=1464554 RepID=UPI0002F9142B|nr:MarR family transcriptional regulator [Aeromicrobium massiliense]
MTADSPAEEPAAWLDADEKAAWTGLISIALLMPGRLEAPLRRFGLTLFDYMSLSAISEAPDRRLRMSELAYITNGSLPRLSNVLKRFEQKGWAERHPDPDDGRYTVAALTDAGYEMVVRAAPTHVRAVRDFVLDPLPAEDRAALARIAERLRIRPGDH